jgi:predicted restriction endonuclease
VKIKLTSLDKDFSKIVRRLAGFKCEYCGKTVHPQGLHCSHFIGRRYRNTRWDVRNCASLCMGCHNHMHDFASDHRAFFVQRLGSDGVEELERLARSGNKVDMEQIKKELKEKLRLLEAE